MTEKQRKFIEYYQGNGVEAASRAGYRGSKAVLAQVAYENLRKPEIQKALGDRNRSESEQIKMNRQERLEFLDRLFKDTSNEIRIRLRACELLGKALGDFIHQTNKSNEHGVSAAIMETVGYRESNGD